MLNVHRGLPRKFDDLKLWVKLLILLTFPVWGPLGILVFFAACFTMLLYGVAAHVWETLLSFLPEEKS